MPGISKSARAVPSDIGDALAFLRDTEQKVMAKVIVFEGGDDWVWTDDYERRLAGVSALCDDQATIDVQYERRDLQCVARCDSDGVAFRSRQREVLSLSRIQLVGTHLVYLALDAVLPRRLRILVVEYLCAISGGSSSRWAPSGIRFLDKEPRSDSPLLGLASRATQKEDEDKDDASCIVSTSSSRAT